MEENKKAAEQTIKEKQAAKKAKEAEEKQVASVKPLTKNPAEVHKGMIVQLPPPKKEKAGMCIVRDAFMYCEPCNMVGVHPGQVDFINDAGTVRGGMEE